MWRFFFYSLLVFSVVSSEVAKERMKRFSIFSLVQFPNSDCTLASSTSTNPMQGTCFTQSECQSNGGSASGNCASGFGVCCFLSVSTCGSTISKNGTYIQNPGNPAGYTTAGTCTYTFTATSDICQLRFDFNTLTLTQPGNAGANLGSCNTDSVSFVSASASSTTFAPVPPPLCGVLTGSHIYLETGRVANAGTMTFTIGSGVSATTRAWKIKVSQIECGNPNAAPTDCLQYYTGVSGTFSSFNYNGGLGQTIANQNYNMCFRQEQGYCKVAYSQDAATSTTTPKTFNLGSSGALSTVSQRLCPEAGIIIPTNPADLAYTNSLVAGIATAPANPTASQRDTYCGPLLNQFAYSTVSGVVLANIPPFNIGVYSTGIPLTLSSTGFNLMYRQVPC